MVISTSGRGKVLGPNKNYEQFIKIKFLFFKSFSWKLAVVNLDLQIGWLIWIWTRPCGKYQSIGEIDGDFTDYHYDHTILFNTKGNSNYHHDHTNPSNMKWNNNYHHDHTNPSNMKWNNNYHYDLTIHLNTKGIRLS